MQDPKSRGGRKKTTGKGIQLQVRVHDDLLKPLDEWIEAQRETGLTRAEAIRRLLRHALSQKTRNSPVETPEQLELKKFRD